MSKDSFKLVTEFPIIEYRCGARAGEFVRLRRDLSIRDHRDIPTGTVHIAGETWKIISGSSEETRVLWLRDPGGKPHTWSDDEAFWTWFERVGDQTA